MFFGYYSLLVYEIQAVYITLVLRNRDLVTLYCCFGHLLSEILCYLIKHHLKIPRPEQGPPGGGLFEGRFGMPSQHCHCFAFLFTMVLLLTHHYYRNYISTSKKILTVTISTLALTLQVIGRIYLRFHTIDQCLVGLFLGILTAISYYCIGLGSFLKYSNTICSHPLMSFFCFRKDLVSFPPSEQANKSKSKLSNKKSC